MKVITMFVRSQDVVTLSHSPHCLQLETLPALIN